MNGLHHHIHHHAKKVVHHVRTHHKKYLFAGSMVAAFFAITKVLVFFATSFALFATSHDTSFADDLAIDPLTQDTGAIVSDTGSISTGLSNEDLALLGLVDSGAVTTGDVSTGDVSIETGALLYLLSVHAAGLEFGTGDQSTGSISTGDQSTGSISTGVVLSGSTNTGIISSTTTTDTTTSGDYYQALFANQITYCHTGSISMATVLSGETFAGIVPFQWTYSGSCITDNLSFQLYDHNHNWIEISKLSGSNLGFSFDSKFLLTGGWYSTTGINASGLVYVVNTGLYTGVSSAFATGYKVRILNDAGEQLYQSSEFAIDNLAPVISGIKLLYSGSSSTGSVHFLFSGNELLNYIKVKFSSGSTMSQTVSGSAYDYVLGGFGTGFSGAVGYTISFSDLWGNTGAVSGTGYLNFSGNTSMDIFTGAFSALLAMKEEINKFNTCKSDLSYKLINLDISDKQFKLAMPDFRKSDVKKLVSAFSYFMVKKLDTVDLTQSELDEITKTYNNFLVVLKLVKDDDNECSQNLGNYYMRLFSTTMANYGITDL